ncbi:MAG TPA: hypothetical protein VHP30_05190, partial [Ignavibacteriales bacterium]|nr:hypothetical protein [Ignavibacteriales bacterium]
TLYDETRALSPQVKALFEVVRAQALEYARAFELVDAKAREIDRLESVLKNLSDSFRVELDEQFKETSQKLENYFERIDNVYEESFRRVEYLKDIEFTLSVAENMALRLKELETTLAPKLARFEELSAALTEYKQEQIDKGSSELEETLKGIADSVYQDMLADIREEGKRIENKIDLRQKFIEGRMINMENSFWEVRQDFAESSRRLSERMDRLRAAIAGINTSQQQLSKELKNRISLLKTEIDKKFMHIDTALRGSNAGNVFYNDAASNNGVNTDTVHNYAAALEAKINQLEVRFNSLKKERSAESKPKLESYKALVALSLLLGIASIIISLML